MRYDGKPDIFRTAKFGKQRFARRFGGKVIHTPGRGWLVFDGKRWRPDVLFQVTELAKEPAGSPTKRGTWIGMKRGRRAASSRRSRWL